MKTLLVLVLIAISSIVANESEVLQDFSVENNLFASDIYKELSKYHSGNFLVSPISVKIILALAHAGAEGKTAQELSTGLYLPESKEKIQKIIQNATQHLKSGDKYTLTSANKIYIKEGYKILDNFKSTAVNIFKSDIQTINFANTDQAASTINNWVEIQTNGKINDLIDKDDLDEDTRTVLINAMYFHGKWVHAFPTRATAHQTFYPHPNKQIKVTMMQLLEELKYYESSELKAKFLELPYEGDDVTMTIALPMEKEGLSRLERRLPETLTQHKYEKHLVEVKLPKFEIKSSTEFKPILKALGIMEAFTDDANFRGILVDEALKISNVLQKAIIEVDELGTTASVASAGEMPALDSEFYVPPPVIEFVADHPFIYFIKIKGIVIFVGRYTGA